MAVRSPIVISSPPRLQPSPIYCSSSPDLPPLSSLLKERSTPGLKTGSGASSIAAGLTQGFQSARTLQRELGQDDDIKTTQIQQKPRKRRKRSIEYDKNAQLCSRESPSAKAGSTGCARPHLSPKASRLGRFTFQQTEAIVEDDEATLGQHAIISTLADPNLVQQSPTCLLTPPKDHEAEAVVTTGKLVDRKDFLLPRGFKITGNVSQHFSSNPRRDKERDKHLQTNEEPAIHQIQTTKQATPSPVLQEPQRDEAVVEIPAEQSSEKKEEPKKEFNKTAIAKSSKKPTKSARTVTSVAIARYQSIAHKEEESNEKYTSLWDRAGCSNTAAERALAILDPASASKRKAKKKQKDKEKTRKTKLLDPEAAQVRLERQDVFFGTSSQLTRDEPIEHIRDLQQAIKESQRTGSCVHGEAEDEKVRGRLWDAGSRDEEQSLLEAECLPMKQKKQIRKESCLEGSAGGDGSCAKVVLRTAQKSVKGTMLKCLQGGDGIASPSASALGSIPINLLSPEATGIDQQRTYATSTTRSKNAKASPKRPKGRPRKKSTASLTSAQEDKGDVGRSRKRSEKAYPSGSTKRVMIDDSEDLDDRGDTTKKVSGKPKLARKDERQEFLTTEASSLFPAISRALKNQERDKDDRSKLTWQEKMLLYDPIVLEDLTAWLKREGVNAEDDAKQYQLQAWMVQLWCEEHSVCCLWKEGLRGGVKSKY